MSNRHDIAPTPPSKPAPRKAAPMQPPQEGHGLDGGANDKPVVIKLTREFLKARAAGAPPLSLVSGSEDDPAEIEAEAGVEGPVKAAPDLSEGAKAEAAVPTQDRPGPQAAVRKPPRLVRKGIGTSNPRGGGGGTSLLLARLAAEDAELKAKLGIKFTSQLYHGRMGHAGHPDDKVGANGHTTPDVGTGPQGQAPAKPQYTTRAARTLAANPGKKGGSSFVEKLQNLGIQQDTEKRMLRERCDSLLFHVVRFVRVFRLARPLLKPEQYHLPGEMPHRIILRHLYKLADSGDYPPGAVPFAALRGAIMDELSGLTEMKLKESWVEELLAEPDDHTDGPGLLWRCYHEPDDRLDEREGIALLRRFVRQRTYDVLPTLLDGLHGRTFVQFPKELADLQALDLQLATLGENRRSFREELDGLLNTVSEGWGRELLGVKTGMDRLDKYLGGLQGLTVLGAPPGTGKTVLVTQLGLGVAENHAANDAVVIFLVLDMPKEVIETRVISHATKLDFEVITRGSRELRKNPAGPYFNEADGARLEEGVARLQDEGTAERLFFLGREDVGKGVSAASLRAIVDACKAKAGARRALLIVDYLQLLPGPPPPPTTPGARPGPTRPEDPLEAARRLIEVVQDAIKPPEGTPPWARDAALVVSETRKANPNAKGNSEQTLDDLMGTTRLAYAADAILLLRPMTGPDVERVYKVKDDSVKLKRDRLKGQRIAPLMLKIEKARDGMYKGDLALEFEYTRSTMTPVHDPFEADPGGVQPPHPGGQASPAPTSTPTPAGASAGGHGAIGHSVPASPPAVPEAPPQPLGPSGQAVVPSAAPEAGTARGKVLEALPGFPAGETTNVIAKAAKLSNKQANEVLAKLVGEGLVVAVKVTKIAGKGLKTFDGFALVNTGGQQGPTAL